MSPACPQYLSCAHSKLNRLRLSWTCLWLTSGVQTPTQCARRRHTRLRNCACKIHRVKARADVRSARAQCWSETAGCA